MIIIRIIVLDPELQGYSCMRYQACRHFLTHGSSLFNFVALLKIWQPPLLFDIIAVLSNCTQGHMMDILCLILLRQKWLSTLTLLETHSLSSRNTFHIPLPNDHYSSPSP